MLKLVIPANELWNEKSQEFVNTEETVIVLEHSLVAMSKWESKWHKPFLSSDKTNEEIIDYIKCMTITQNVKPETYMFLTSKNFEEIDKYINDPMTATTFVEDKFKTKHNREIITSELIYYWMIALNIPFECQKWHINRLLTLIRICNVKNAPAKKMSKSEILNRNRSLNASRRASLHSKG